MSIFGALTTNGMEVQKDSTGGYSPLETNIYTALVKNAYVTTSKNGAMAINLILDIDGREYREQIWITNSKGENFFVNKKTGNKVALPGFTTINDICLVGINKPLSECDTEPKVVKIYDFNAKAEVPREVPTIVELIGAAIKVGIVHQIVDKNVQDASGNYVPSGETREENVIDKVFHEGTNLTVNEAKAEVTEATFFKKWLDKNKGVVRNKAKGASGSKAGSEGAPKKPTKSLFG